MAGIRSFTEAISAEWALSFDQDPIFIGYRLEAGSSAEENKANMATFLNNWQHHMANRPKRPSGLLEDYYTDDWINDYDEMSYNNHYMILLDFLLDQGGKITRSHDYTVFL